MPKKQAVRKLLDDAEATRQKLLAYCPENAADLENKSNVAAFTAHFDKIEKGLREYYQAKDVALPKEWHVGFGEYKSAPPKEDHIGYLSYQLDAFDSLFRDMADTGISAVLNFHREKLAPEQGKPWGYQDLVLDARGNPLRKQPRQIYKSLPFEIVIQGREEAIRKAINTLANSKNHFFIVPCRPHPKRTHLRSRKKPMSNSRTRALLTRGGGEGDFGDEFPDADDVGDAPAGGEAPAEGDDGGFNDDFGNADAAPASQRILSIVAGDEELVCLIRGELVLFEDGITLPSVK